MAQRAFGKGKATRVFLALLLAFSLVGIGAVPAAADPADDTQAAVDAAQATLDEAESRMAQINSEYEQLTAEVAELQTKIDETAAAAMEAQQAMRGFGPGGRGRVPRRQFHGAFRPHP